MIIFLESFPFILSSVTFCISCPSTRFAQVFVRFAGSFVGTYLVLRLDFRFTKFVQVSKVSNFVSLLDCRFLII